MGELAPLAFIFVVLIFGAILVVFARHPTSSMDLDDPPKKKVTSDHYQSRYGDMNNLR